MRFHFFIKKISLVLLLAASLALTLPGGAVTVLAEEKEEAAGELYALSAVLMDADNGRILLQKNGEQALPMASTTKIMTCILTLEEAELDDYVSVSSYAAGMPKVHLGVRKGQVFRLRDLLYSLMLESHNDSAAIIAEHVGNLLKGGGKRSADNTEEESRDSILRFTTLMNAKAEEIGCENTFFVTPNGLDGILTLTDGEGNQVEKQHSTTAADLARIMSYCVTDSPKRDEFLEITRTPSYSFTDYELGEGSQWRNGGRQYACSNHNAFLGMMEGALTGKTGFTGKAGYCYVGALRRDGKTFSIALLACGWPNNKSWKWHDAAVLYEYGLNHYEKKNIYQSPDLPLLPVTGGICDSVALACQEQELTLLLSQEDQVSVQMELADSLEAPFSQGTRVGTQDYYVDGRLYASLPIVTAEGVEQITYRYCLEQLLERILF